MGFLSRLLRLRPKQTRLEAFLSGVTPERMLHACSSSSEEVRVPMAISVRSLHIAVKFSDGLRDMVRKVGRGFAIEGEHFPVDAVAFEAAAYTYYWLMREALLHDVEPDEEEEIDEEEAEFLECLKLAASATSEIFVQHADFNVKSDLLMNRCLAYSFEEGMKATPPDEKFTSFLLSSIQSRSPSEKHSVGLSTSLPLQLCVATYVPIWTSTLLDELKKGTREFYESERNRST